MGNDTTDGAIILEKLNRKGIVLAVQNEHGGHDALTKGEALSAMDSAVGPEWMEQFSDPRDIYQIAACVHYARYYPKAGLPGHTLMLLVGRLVDALNRRKEA